MLDSQYMMPESEKKSRVEALSLDQVPLGEIVGVSDLKILATRHIDKEAIKSVYSMVKTGFSEHNQHSFTEQDMTYDELLAEAEDPTVLKYIAKNDNGEIQGYLSVHSNLSDITWADTNLLNSRQSEFGPGEIGFYVATFIVPKELRGFKVSGALLEGALSQLVNFNKKNGNQSLCFFDRSEEGSAAMREFISRKLEKITAGEPPYSIEEIDKAIYLALPDTAYASRTGQAVQGPSASGGLNITAVDKQTEHYWLITGADLDAEGKLGLSAVASLSAAETQSTDKLKRTVVVEARSAPAVAHLRILDTQHFYEIRPPRPAASVSLAE